MQHALQRYEDKACKQVVWKIPRYRYVCGIVWSVYTLCDVEVVNVNIKII